jgi:N-acetylmuramoyl-L-alanine amidase
LRSNRPLAPLIRAGEHSQRVADVQARLRALGHNVDDEIGSFADGTVRAVRAFQQSRGILADGIVGPNTWGELVEASWRLGDRALYLRHPLLRGDDVNALQARLNALGFDAGREDGIFGVATDRAVRAFQREYDVAEDGIFGPVSYAALNGLRIDRPGTSALIREELRFAERSGISSALIVLDPGHGGDDPGDFGPAGRAESEMCWDIAIMLMQRLIELGARVRLTRERWESPDTSERARRANDLGADLFISIHLNSHVEATAEGACTYYWRTSRAGEKLADQVQMALVGLGIRDCRSHPRSYQLLRETRMPAVLVEPCFITNHAEEKKVGDSQFRASIAAAIATAVGRYYEATSLTPASVE